MRILKIFLYVTLIISLSWSALFFMGPYLIKWTVEKYTDGQIIVSDASLTPKFDLNIGRVSYNIKKTERSEPIIGFSRGLSVSWSILNSAPFLNLTSGPTVLKDFGELKAIEIGTANFSDFDYDEPMFFSNLFGLELNSDISIETLYLSSSLKDNLSKLIGLSFELKNLKSDKIGELSVDNVSGRLKSLDLTLPISTQQVLISLDAQDISQKQFYITVSDLGGDVNFYNGDMTFDLTANQLGVAKLPLQMKSLNLDGRYFFGPGNISGSANADFKEVDIFNEILNISTGKAVVSQSSADDLEVNLAGNTARSEILINDLYFATLPELAFKVDLDYESDRLEAVSAFHSHDLNSIPGQAEGEFTLKNFGGKNLWGCFFQDCSTLGSSGEFLVDLGGEKMFASVKCDMFPCSSDDWAFDLKTNDTKKFFENLTSTNIINPMALLYFYNMILSGQASGHGHGVNF